MKTTQRSLCLLLTLALLAGLSLPVGAATSPTSADVAALVLAQSPSPSIGTNGGEWAVIGLARSDAAVPADYYLAYYLRVAQAVQRADGILSARKYTEYARITLALTAIGRDPTDVAGYDLVSPLADFDAVARQGTNGLVWALIALTAAGAEPEARQQYLDALLTEQRSDGGWSLTGDAADADLTAMALISLAPYQDTAAVDSAVSRALSCLSEIQLSSGGFATYSVENAESCAQVIIALCSLGVSLDDPRFVCDGQTVLDALRSFYVPGAGFCHIKGGAVNQIATEQALLALCAAARASDGRCALFDMADAPTSGAGLPGKADTVHATTATRPGSTFPDVDGHANQIAIEALATRGVINGRSSGQFDPDSALTRAEFAALVSRALGLTETTDFPFTDILNTSALAGGIGAAYQAGIVNGLRNDIFNPGGTLTRQQACAMLARACALCGLDTTLSESEITAALAPYADSAQCASYARAPLALCLQQGILTPDGQTLAPQQAITRAEMAELLYRTLLCTNLM